MKLKISLLMLLLVGLLPVISQAEEGHSVYYYLMIDRFESGEKMVSL
ncbi:hypothetical protein [Piscibacillus salipiscarius]|nr:hypothetical protein [Piscibacillus salipiscarius]